ncbi:MAG TPA: hypothetical protein PLB02_05895 [Thermoanaerobaculia bacterium]|nr:hypothetical protein [Thermoanaerobaculia bacterium]HQR66908.1 hypothetical protein [Thermoanaerobaculia bacterium]
MPRFTVLETSALFSNRMKYDYLFEMEMWLKGMERFFTVDYLPLSPFERSHASLKNYVEEVGVIRAGVNHMAMLTTHLLGEGKEDLASFLLYLDSQVGRVPSGAPPARRRSGAEAELALVVEKLDDFSKILDEMSKASFLPLQTYLSLGRIVIGTLKQDPNLGILFNENLRPVLDRTSKQSLQRVLSTLNEPAHKGALAALLVQLFKGLRYVEMVRSTIGSPATRKRALLVFSLLRGESDGVCEFLRKRLLPRFPEESDVAEGLERVISAQEQEVRKVMEVELVDVALMKDPGLVLTRLEDAAGLLRDLYQQTVIGLAETFSSEMDGRSLFPDYRTRREQSQRLRDDLALLVRTAQAFRTAPDKKTLLALVTELEAFRQGSMRYLMYKDWSLVERFLAGFSRERPPRTFLPAAGQFELFLKTLIREVGKRSVLAAPPARPAGADAAPESGGPPARYN